MRYAVVIERAKKNFSAYAPDVPGCAAVGDTVQEVMVNIKEALEFHFEGTREDGDPIPDPASLVAYVEVDTEAPAPNHVTPPRRPSRKRFVAKA